ncbi:MAG: hypothetical protein JWQ20_1226 [Conexibacter sp.]|nr:hypothetical protein [Conexibacter sp.]
MDRNDIGLALSVFSAGAVFGGPVGAAVAMAFVIGLLM